MFSFNVFSDPDSPEQNSCGLLEPFQTPADPQEKIMRIPRNNLATFRKNSAPSQEKISTSQEKIQQLSA
jgi:hypothetical protein